MPTLWSERIFFEKTIYILKFFWKYTYLFLYQNVFDFLRILSWRLFIIIIKTFSSIRILQIIVNWGLVIITSLHDFICVISGRMVEGLTILDGVVGLYMINKIVIIRNFLNKTYLEKPNEKYLFSRCGRILHAFSMWYRN